MRLPVVALSLIAAVAAVGLTGCEKQTKAPFQAGVCLHVIEQKDGTLKFNPVAQNVPSLELCAAELEGMRLRFVRLGSPNREMTGAYQGKFIFLQKEGIYLGDTYEGARFMSLVRTGDGRLAVPGAMPPQ
ncbi:hypothetical protein [Caulobacter sp. UNC279MFTsu5.1]|uniref:hypothetical protein n=1 Tax=Caulobacter sp. UNC279MFTsu5.1 TaxID=1502775 RepID=UPI0008EFB9A1|nr:hypothetical protein [Caulobacter sp. UNC279MFTsu5.1]SFK66114.1 hypothetical protein SAMN02799626_04862 [Caulobacter sp. UNC279MFTsu5.1]